MRHPAVPPPASLSWIVVACLVWLAAAITGGAGDAPIEEGPFAGKVTLLEDPRRGRFGDWALAGSEEAILLLSLRTPVEVARGDVLDVTGRVTKAPDPTTRSRHEAVLVVNRINEITPSRFWLHRAGVAIRRAVDVALEPHRGGRALLGGFLIGDVSHLTDSEIQAMRRSGLAHFVAVSGSNVVLFLGLLAVVAGPLSLGPRRRAVVGLLGLPVYVAATRFEPSVVRAAVMAGIALGGRLLGFVLEAWQLLSVAVIGLVAIDPLLTSNVGFQLSVAATAGVLVGSRWPAKGRLSRPLLVTIGAQAAVAPLMLLHFDTVPLMSPLLNLVAGPLVALSTLMGAIGVLGLRFMVGPAAWLAQVVLDLARAGAGWPQLGPLAFCGAMATAIVLAWSPPVRRAVAVPVALCLVVVLVVPNARLPPGAVAVLDVGQGDAILISGGDGHFALVDGGPRAEVITAKLQDYGVKRLDLVIASHVHADHVTGLVSLVGAIDIARVWAAVDPHSTEASAAFLTALSQRRMAPEVPDPGERVRLGELEIVVQAPIRRYASPNDQSIVVTVEGSRRSMLLTGDIETFAQADLGHLRADVLKVPHQGAATSDPEWLRSVGADLAVISVGPNSFGHPADWVIGVLEESGATVLRTDQAGDVVVDLGEA